MNWRNNRQGGYSQNNGYGGNRQPRNQGNGQQGYLPNTGKLRVNREKQSVKQPDFKGVGNIEIEGVQHTVFVSLWFNQDQNTGEDTIRLTFTQPNSPQLQQGGQRPQQRPQQAYGGQQRMQGNYQPYPNERPQNGAMSRARPIPPQPVYDDSPPPHDGYPDGPDYGDGEQGPPY